MRILMFHGTIDSLNHFTDNAQNFLEEIGCETLICTLPPTEQDEERMMGFLKAGVHAVIVYDGIGMYLKEIFDKLDIPVVNILVDHPMTLVHCMAVPPHKYIQFSPDERHVEFSRKYWDIENSFFLPHMGTAPELDEEDRSMDIFFSGSYVPLETLVEKVRKHDGLKDIFFDMTDCMMADSSITIEEACHMVLKNRGIEPSSKGFALILAQAKPVDVYIRMNYRTKVIKSILDRGVNITVAGGSWNESDAIHYPNFHWIPPMPFTEVFQYMRRSKIVLNVMPCFKAGTHERIFNALLSGACPLTDKSKWLIRNFSDKKDIAFYDLNGLENLPGMIEELLQNNDLREGIVGRGREKVIRNYTTANVIGGALQKVIDLYYS